MQKREFDNIFIESADYQRAAAGGIKSLFRYEGIVSEKSTIEGGEVVTIGIDRPLFMDTALQNALIGVTGGHLKDLLKKYKIDKNDVVLVVGVGNESMTADALGAKTLKYLEITEHFYRAGFQERGKGRLCGIAGNVSGVTGIDSFDVIKGVCERVKPSIVIAVDTLASKRISRLQRVIQITDKGLTPGGGVNNEKTELSRETLDVPVIAVGVPLVIYARHILTDYSGEFDVKLGRPDLKRAHEEINSLVVTLKEIDVSVEDFARVIGRAVNKAVHRV
jgi:spore protease